MRSTENDSRMRQPTCRRLIWIAFARLCTLLIPDLVLLYGGSLTTAAARNAWREKMAMGLIFFSLSGCLCIWLEYVSTLFCDFEKALDFDIVYGNRSTLVGVNGCAYNWSHTDFSTGIVADMVTEVEQYPHQDLSDLFPTFQLLMRPEGVDNYADSVIQACIGDQNRTAQADGWLSHRLSSDPAYLYENNQLISCPLPNQRNTTGAKCFDPQLPELSKSGLRGKITYDATEVAANYSALPSAGNTTRRGYVILNGMVLDVTSYLVAATNIVNVSTTMRSRAFALDRMFLPLDLTILLYVHLGEDISPYFAGNSSGNPDLYRQCLQTLFFKGVTSDGIATGCATINPALWATMGIGLLYFLIKMNLANLSRLSTFQSLFHAAQAQPKSLPGDAWPYTLLMIPCFSEPAETVRQTFESLARTTYDDTRKMLLFVCDGMTRGAHDAKEMHVGILESLGHSCTEDPVPQAYHSLGQYRRKVNYAKVYAGYYETGRNRVPYLVVVKVGGASEGDESGDQDCRPPGNRGKRDSLVMIMGFLERCMDLANHCMTPLEYELFNQCYSVLGIDPRWFKYLLVIDAHTQVKDDVVQKLVSRLEKDHQLLAISGHARPANPEQNLTTMLQIYPHYMNFFSSLAYETCLRSVMSINNGFVMYKLWANRPETRTVSSQDEKWTTQRLASDTTSQQPIRMSWPKENDELDSQWSDDDDDDDDGYDNDHLDEATKNRAGNHRYSTMSVMGAFDGRLSLQADVDRKPCCIHPTVLRGLATSDLGTMHMRNVLLLGEDRYMSIVLLTSHPHHRLGFEPEAIGYATLPTRFWSLQGMQSRMLRAAFHTLLETHQVAWHIGFSYWALSLAELLDLIFSGPITVYLYSIFIRTIWGKGLAYLIITGSFSGLILLHIFYFTVRRQFKYVFWFVLYCLLSVPLFVVWFPLVALWQMNVTDRWHEVYPTTLCSRQQSRRHGLLDIPENPFPKRKDSNDTIRASEQKVHSEALDVFVPRMRLAEYELAEAHRSHLEAERALDSKFTGFTGFGSRRTSMHSPSVASFAEKETAEDRPSLSQTREMYAHMPIAASSGLQLSEPHPTQEVKRRIQAKDTLYGRGTLRRYPFDHPTAAHDPFEDSHSAMTIDNPFDDVNAAGREDATFRKYHKASRSQSSYSTAISNKSSTAYLVDGNTLLGSANSSGFSYARQPPPKDYAPSETTTAHQVIGMPATDRSSMFSIASHAHSLASSSLSLDPEAFLEASDHHMNDLESEEGRRVALHSRVGLRFPTPKVDVSNGRQGTRRVRRKAPELKKSPEEEDEVVDEEDEDEDRRPEATRGKRKFQTLLRTEIYGFLATADLDLTTRAEVKDHLFRLFGQRIDNDDTQTFIHECIEAITLEHVSR